MGYLHGSMEWRYYNNEDKADYVNPCAVEKTNGTFWVCVPGRLPCQVVGCA